MQKERMTPVRWFAVILFQLANRDPEWMEQTQAKFLTDSAFWRPFIGRLMLWAQPFAVSRTESPDGLPALALFVDGGADAAFLQELASEMAAALEVGAYALVAAELDEEMYASLQGAPKPWLGDVM